jgi:hypothetical protein
MVSGLWLSGSSRSASPPPAACAPELAAEKDAVGRIPVQDRLGWREPQPSRKTMWHHRKAAQREAEAAALRTPSPRWAGCCFKCGEPGHRKIDCTSEPLCI